MSSLDNLPYGEQGKHIQGAWDFIAEHGSEAARKLVTSRPRYNDREQRCTGCEDPIKFSDVYYVWWNILAFPYCEACHDAVKEQMSDAR